MNGQGEGPVVVGDLLVDTSCVSPVDHVVMVSTTQEITLLLSGLDDREREIVSMRFGLHQHGPRTLRDVARQFGITSERVRQIEARAIDKLRRAARGVDG